LRGLFLSSALMFVSVWWCRGGCRRRCSSCDRSIADRQPADGGADARWDQREGPDRYDKWRRRLLLQIGASVPGEDASSRTEQLVSSTSDFQTLFHFSTIISMLELLASGSGDQWIIILSCCC
jgi:hypothetical protein